MLVPGAKELYYPEISCFLEVLEQAIPPLLILKSIAERVLLVPQPPRVCFLRSQHPEPLIQLPCHRIVFITVFAVTEPEQGVLELCEAMKLEGGVEQLPPELEETIGRFPISCSGYEEQDQIIGGLPVH